MTVLTRATPERSAPARAGLLTRLLQLDAVWRSRRALGRLERGHLADVGLDPAQARREAARPIWDAPAHWLR